MTIQQLISSSLQAIGELAPGQTPSSTESHAALAILNDIVSGWTTQHRKVYVIDNVQFPLDSGRGHYTLGPNSDFTGYRPAKIQSAGIVRYDSGDLIGLKKDLTIVNSKDWAAIPEKGMQAHLPLKIYADNDYPSVNLHLWPIPVCPA